MRCPKCNAKWRWKRDIKKDKCHKCGYGMKMSDFLVNKKVESVEREDEVSDL